VGEEHFAHSERQVPRTFVGGLRRTVRQYGDDSLGIKVVGAYAATVLYDYCHSNLYNLASCGIMAAEVLPWHKFGCEQQAT
jgi:hypothetical protein